MKYQRTQLGITILIIMGVALGLVLMAHHVEEQAIPWWIYAVIIVISILFSTLTIKVSNAHISWFFGPYFWRKKVLLKEVVSIKKVRNKWYCGFGIRLQSTGWLYNVSGLTAVQLTLKDGTHISLGTHDADNLLKVIEAQMPSNGI
ncbi:hypothetical protein [uncultured Shewanella sp.]|uniref:hypothetical protein n=1 Tax=uncultured Shewanella sp. TaxID=173975 RepID=UPI00262D21E9|nr:hypothetical protein [uncultured Shewanella sp.]